MAVKDRQRLVDRQCLGTYLRPWVSKIASRHFLTRTVAWAASGQLVFTRMGNKWKWLASYPSESCVSTELPSVSPDADILMLREYADILMLREYEINNHWTPSSCQENLGGLGAGPQQSWILLTKYFVLSLTFSKTVADPFVLSKTTSKLWPHKMLHSVAVWVFRVEQVVVEYTLAWPPLQTPVFHWSKRFKVPAPFVLFWPLVCPQPS